MTYLTARSGRDVLKGAASTPGKHVVLVTKHDRSDLTISLRIGLEQPAELDERTQRRSPPTARSLSEGLPRER